MCHGFKALNGQAPKYLSDLLIKSEQIKNLRSNDRHFESPIF